MKKLFLIIVVYVCGNHCFGQRLDTVEIRKYIFESVINNSGYLVQNDTYLINEKSVDKETFYLLTKQIDSISDFLSDNQHKYFIFYDEENRIVEEGCWGYEVSFTGYYKSYHTNGNIKEEGYYTELCDSTFFPGQKTGKWNYYKADGKLEKQLKYVPENKLKYKEYEPIIPPCTCKQKDLYKYRKCITLPPSKLKGVTHFYSTDSILGKKSIVHDSNYSIESVFLQKYIFEFMDSVFSKNECVNDNIFAIKIYTYNPKDTLLEFFISYIKSKDELSTLYAKNYITVRNRKVLVKFGKNISIDALLLLKKMTPALSADEDFNNYIHKEFTSPYEKVYKGEYKLHKNKIEASFSLPYYENIPHAQQLFAE